MKILYRYVWSEALLFFGICLFAFTGILLTLRMLRFAALIVDKGVELSQIGIVFLAIVPTFLEIAIPLATLLGVMLAFGRLSGDSEIVVMRASGISIGQLAWPAAAFGLSAAAVGMVVSSQLKPWGFETLARTLFEIARTKSTSGLEPGIFNKLGSLTLYAEGIDHLTGELTKVMIDDRRSESDRKVFLASSGLIRSDETNRTIEFILRNAEIHEQDQRAGQQRRISPPWRSAEIRLSIDPNQLFERENQKGRAIAEMSIPELRERLAYLSGPLLRTFSTPPISIEALESPLPEQAAAAVSIPAGVSLQQELPDSTDLETVLLPENYPLPVPSSVFAEPTTESALSRRILRSEIELGQRFSLPFASLALALLALPLGIQPPRAHRTWGAGLSATLGLAVFVLYYGAFSVGVVLAQAQVIPTTIALWLPNFLVIALAALALHRTANERWTSVASALHDAAMSIGRRIAASFSGRIRV